MRLSSSTTTRGPTGRAPGRGRCEYTCGDRLGETVGRLRCSCRMVGRRCRPDVLADRAACRGRVSSRGLRPPREQLRRRLPRRRVRPLVGARARRHLRSRPARGARGDRPGRRGGLLPRRVRHRGAARRQVRPRACRCALRRPLPVQPPPEYPELEQELRAKLTAADIAEWVAASGRDYSDERVRAGFLVCPALGPLLDKGSLSQIEGPVMVRWVDRDEVTVPAENAQLYADLIPGRTAGRRTARPVTMSFSRTIRSSGRYGNGSLRMP